MYPSLNENILYAIRAQMRKTLKKYGVDMGSLSCLNVSGGDITITFDTKNVAEAIRAKRIITDILRRGYALMVKTEDGSFTRAYDFDAEKGEYIIADFDESYTHEQKEEKQDEQIEETPEKEPNTWIKKGQEQPKPRKGRRKRVGMEKSEVVAVAPSAGG